MRSGQPLRAIFRARLRFSPKGVAVNGVIKKVGLGVVASIAGIAIAIGIGEPKTTSAGPPAEKSPVAKEDKPAERKPPAAKAEKKSTQRTITGKVVDPNGKPVAGAEIVHLPIDGVSTVVGKSAADGTFQVTVPMNSPHGSHLFPRVDGWAPNTYLMPATNTPAEITFKLIKDTPIKGRVIDTQGKPVVGALIVVRHISGYANDSIDGFLTAWQKRQPDSGGPGSKWTVSFRSWEDRKPPKTRGVYAASTDNDGRFAIANVGSERLVRLHIRGPGIAEDEVMVVTRAGFDPEPYNKATREKIRSPYSELGYHPMLHAPQTNIVAEAEKPIRGVVKEIATGKPRVGVKVTLREQRSKRLPDVTATTDSAGRFVIHGANKTSKYVLVVHRDPNAGLIGRSVTVPDTPAYEPVVADIDVGKGIILTGRVLDASTGKPIPGFACVGVLSDNTFVKKPEFDSVDCYDFANTDKDGVYRTVVPPGPVLLMGGPTPDAKLGAKVYFMYEQLRTDPDYPDYFSKELSGFHSPGGATTVMQGQWCKVLKLKPEQKEMKLDIVLKRASTFTIKVQNADGKPANNLLAAGTTSQNWMYPNKCDGDSCLIYGLDGKKPRVVAICDLKRHEAAVVTITGTEKSPFVAKLQPTATVKGVLVNAAGKPIPHVAVIVSFKDRAVGEVNNAFHGDARDAGAIETNERGEFTVPDVVAGQKFSVFGRRNGMFLTPPDRNLAFTVKASETKDLGKVTLNDQ